MRKNAADQFSALRKRAGLSLEELARRMGYRRASSIQRYESPADFRGQYLSMGVTTKLVKAVVGLGNPPISEREVLALGGPLLVRPIERLLPVISFVQAGQWSSAMDPYSAGDGFAEIRADMPVSAHAFALEIRGTSMLSRFEEGDRIIIDPEVEPMPGDFVVAKQDTEDAATFKQYRPRGTDNRGKPVIDLRPLNDVWPTITLDTRNPGRIIGVMTEHHTYRRKP